MNHYAFDFQNEVLHALASGTLYWPAQNLLCVSDLHFGKAQRYAGFGSSALPPYETHDTLVRLDQDISATGADTIVCLGDSFDRIGASEELDETARDWITRLQVGRRWIWIEGNHDPEPIELAGIQMAELLVGPILFRHIAQTGTEGEISGHYHPKVHLPLRARTVTKRCILMDQHRLIMPAFGTYTGGLSVNSAPLRSLVGPGAICILQDGKNAQPVPRPKLETRT